MNLNFCRFHCGKSWHPTRILKTTRGEWFVVMNDSSHIDEHCDWRRIEPAQDLFDNPPDGWLPISDNELMFEHGNAEDALWRVKLLADEASCPYMAEHTMYDIAHEDRKKEWAKKEQKRRAFIEERMKKHNNCTNSA